MTDPMNRPVPLTNRPTANPLRVRSWRVPALAGVTALGLVLAGCSGDGGNGESSPEPSAATSSGNGSTSESPSTETSGSESSNGSASPSEGGPYEPASSTAPAKNVPVPEMPDAVKEPTQEGLEAAVEYWWEAAFYLRQTGNPEPLEIVSDEDCPLCQDQIVRWSEVYEDGSWVETEPAKITIQFTKLDKDNTGGTTAFLVSESPGELYRSGGERVPEASGDGSKDRPWVAALNFDEDHKILVVEDIVAQGQDQ